jgi:hypothetical protein
MHIGPTAHPLRVTFIAIAACGLVACGGKPAPQATSPEPAAPVADERGRSVASIIDLMKHEVDPSADALWEAVASVATTGCTSPAWYMAIWAFRARGERAPSTTAVPPHWARMRSASA